MRPMRARLGSTLLSVALHAAILLLLRTAALPRMDAIPAPPIPIKLLPPRSAKRAPAAANKAAPPPKPVEMAKAPEPPPKPAPEQEKPPEQKIPLPEQQIVSPPDGGVEKPPEQTRLLSDRDTTVEKEMIHHGEPAPPEKGPAEEKEAAPKRGGQPKPAPEKRRREPLQVASLPRLEQLLPSAMEIAADELKRDLESGKAEAQAEARHRSSADVPFPAADVFGTLDFLPDVQSGQITLLNTKADLFAPFVRRVALRVFQNLLIALRRELARLGQSAEEIVTIEAIMSPKGDMVGMEVTQHSPSLSLGTDRLLQQSCRQGFFDRNPPPGAESADGNIHFVMRTRVLAMVSPNQAQYGYRVAFQAGLL
jgi:hypothetical protein